jgi:ATP diphosphatase
MTTPGDRFERLLEVMRTLRSPEGCPWDREQTLQTLRPYLLEEAYEALDAIDRANHDELREELGDLLFEIVFLSQISEEDGHFTIADAIETVTEKLVRRHPHVFGGDAQARSAEEVLGRWQELKRTERAESGRGPKTLLESVPRTLPGLLRAYEYGSRAASAGFDWERASDVVEKMREETAEIEKALAKGQGTGDKGERRENEERRTTNQEPGAMNAELEEEVGDLLFAIANLARKLGVEPEGALRRANNKFERRFTELERRFGERGAAMKDAGLDALEREWQAVKADERRGTRNS